MLIKRERNKNVFFKTLRFPNHYFFSSTPVLLPGKSHGQRSLVGCSPWGLKELDTTVETVSDFIFLGSKITADGDCSQPGSSVPGILQARILEWVAFPFSRGLPNPGIKLRSPVLQVDSLPAEPQGTPKNTGVGSQSLLQGIFLTQESNWDLLHCRRILYQAQCCYYWFLNSY